MASISALAGQSAGIETLISQYMALERRPILDLQSRKSSLNTQSAVFNDMKNKLKALQDAADVLADTTDDSIFEAVKVSSNDTNTLTVTAGTDAAQGTYMFRVRQLATATRMKSTADLNNHYGARSSKQVVDGYDNVLDTDEDWADAGFDTTPDGTVTINGETFTLADYSSVDEFMDAVNDDADADANIWYDSSTDKFTIESTDAATNLVISETGTNGFFTEVNITAATYSSNVGGLEAGALLGDINFDTAIGSTDTGSFKINGTTIEWDASTDTLNSVLSTINHSDAGVTAFYDESLDRVMFTADDMGSEEIEWEDVEGTFLGSSLNLTGVTQTTGQNALFTINSTDAGDEISKSSNSFSVNGLNITLKATTVENDSYSDADTTSVTVSSVKDEDTLKTKINSFLGAYNSAIDYFTTKTNVDVSTYTRGALAGETVFSSLKSDIVGMILGQVDDLDDDKPSYFADIGITLDDNLHASISDASVLSDWLDDDPSAVADLFNSTDGIAAQMVELLEPYTESYGIIDNRKSAISDQMETIDKRIVRLEERMEQREAYYRQQFTALQEMLNQITQQQSMMNNIMSTFNSLTS